MSKVDLSKLKAGDTVVFRDGERQVVKSVGLTKIIDFPYGIDYYCGAFQLYGKEGGWYPHSENPRDIVEIIPAEPVYRVPLPGETFRCSEFWRLRYADGSTADVANWHDVFEEENDIGLLSVTRMVREITTREARIDDLKEEKE